MMSGMSGALRLCVDSTVRKSKMPRSIQCVARVDSARYGRAASVAEKSGRRRRSLFVTWRMALRAREARYVVAGRE